MEKIAIEIDLEVYKHLISKSQIFNEDFNDILRREFKLVPKNSVTDMKQVEKKSISTNLSNTSNNIKQIVNIDKGITAKGEIYYGSKFIVFKGSSLCKTEEPSVPFYTKEKRRELLSNKKIDSNFILLEDYIFNSPSEAASVLFGGSRNGRLIWQL